MGSQPQVESEPRWPASLAVLASIALYAALPDRYTIGPTWLMPLVEGVLLVALTVSAPRRHSGEAVLIRAGAMLLIAVVTVANFFALGQLVDLLLNGSKIQGTELTVAAIQIWLTNVAAFALWFWELDRGGPGNRRKGGRDADFLFPQMSGGAHQPGWMPHFVDYLYLSFTNALAFSPTDTMPLSRWAKLLMLAESLASVLTVAFVAARAVNILS